jgi:hypothetical protein
MERPERNVISRCLTVVILCLGMPAFAQKATVPTKDVFQQISKHLAANYQVPDTVKADCYWNYAVIRLQVDANNKINAVSLVNTPRSEAFRRSFDLLNGFQFTKEVNPGRLPVVFVVSIEQFGGEGCDTPQHISHPSQVLNPILGDLQKQLMLEPDCLFKLPPISFFAMKGVR